MKIDSNDIESLYTTIKKKGPICHLEGLAQPNGEMLEFIVRGQKEFVDEFVGVVDEVVIKYGIKEKKYMPMAVEPCFDAEEYRDIFRFLLTRPQ
jgi:hypothetical protein